MCRAAVGPDVLKRLGVKVDRRMEMMSMIEKGLFDNAFPMEAKIIENSLTNFRASRP